jgi:hypothetical protein
MTTVDAPAPARASKSAPELSRFLAVSFQLALILLVVYRFNLEPHRPFLAVLCLAAVGFLVHAWLPRSLRAGFFALLSMSSVVFLLGWTTGGWVLGIGGGLFVLCYLPVHVAVRALSAAAVAVALARWRIDSVAPFWAFLASMFMFRVIVYLYDTRRGDRPPLFHSLGYFFALPNLCFTLFPVLDFKTFRETYYDDEPYAIYRSGVAWILRGLVHLLAYRFVKYYLLPAPHQMRDLPHVLLFLATNYALYLRVSGWFHVATGVLHLYGFNLPRTHFNYFLASSLTDIWRRINVYWKDFMSKVFFYPAFFALRGWGTPAALVAAGMGVFVATWLLHSYQVFWLLGELPLKWNDAVLWLGAGVVVTGNLVLDLRRAGKASTDPGSRGVGQEVLGAAVRSLKIAGTFLLVSLFWAYWTLPDQLPAYLYVVATSGAVNAKGVLTVLGVVAGVVTAGVVARLVRDGLAQMQAPALGPSLPLSAALVALVIAGSPRLGAALAPHAPHAAEVLATLRLESTTPVEAAVAVQGYYERIADTPMQVSPLLGGRPQPERAGAEYTDFSRPVDAYLDSELIPGWSGKVAGHRLTVNRFGMRDREEIKLEKESGGCRVAVLGSSVVMGWGVEDDEPFPLLLEGRLNAGRGAGQGRVEVLNFGTGASDAIQRRALLDHKVFAFDPDVILFVVHQDEFLAAAKHVSGLYYLPPPLRYPYLEDVLRDAGVTREMPPGQAQARLQLAGPDVLRGVYPDIVAECRRRGIVPVWVYVPMPGVVEVSVKSSELVDLAKEAGFVTINLAKWDEGYGPEEVKSDRHHANALGHRLIAEHLEAALRESPDALPKCARRR